MTDQTTLYTELSMENGTVYYHEDYKRSNYYLYVLIIPFVVISIFGILGNGTVIWLLGCHMKKNHFITYVLNLAIADFSFLAVTVMASILSFFDEMFLLFGPLLAVLYFSMFITSQLLLAVISVDRCVSVFFPLWHQCHRPKRLSTILCVLIWVISFLPPAISAILNKAKFPVENLVLVYQLIVNGIICLLLMITSSLMLFIKVCCKSKQRRKRKLTITILIVVFFFCFFCFPPNAYVTISYLVKREVRILWFYGIFSASLNSIVNPFIYYLVGRPKKGHFNKSVKAVLQKLFKEAEI